MPLVVGILVMISSVLVQGLPMTTVWGIVVPTVKPVSTMPWQLGLLVLSGFFVRSRRS